MTIVGKDGKTYDTVEACLEADKKFEEEAEKNPAPIKPASPNKKEMADAIQVAEDKVSLALAEYERVREEARKKVSAAQAEAGKMLKEAEDKYLEASSERYEAIRDFNEKFGVYTTSYTGKRALDEYNRSVKNFNREYNRILDGIDRFFSIPFFF